MKTSEFDFSLPKECIAQVPLQKRESARLLFVDRKTKELQHKNFLDILGLFGKNDVLVFNKSRVIPARIRIDGKKEIFLSSQVSEGIWLCLVYPGKKFRAGKRISFPDGSFAVVLSEEKNGVRKVQFFPKGRDFFSFLKTFGSVPLPPYITRNLSEQDHSRYQTVFSENPGSVAAPTAGLHFTEEVLDQLQQNGVQIEYVTLHVGLGTFLPVKTEHISDHIMHQEYYEIEVDVAERLSAAKQQRKQITAIGSTSLRTLESATLSSRCLENLSGNTGIFIYPPKTFQYVDHFFTNFHLPKSTLLMLVSAFASPGDTHGRELVLKVYKEAIQQKYRFFSYGDATLWW
jgi:S-adenosylmethionine:tRNA ribosyltransferase-isomerase